MGKVIALSQATSERLLALAQQRACTPEALLHTLLIDAEQAQYYHTNQQMLAQGMLASMPRTPRECRSGIDSGQDPRPTAVADDPGWSPGMPAYSFDTSALAKRYVVDAPGSCACARALPAPAVCP